MNNLTHKTFLALLFVAMSVISWANKSPKDGENPSYKKSHHAVIPPAPPGVAYLGVDRCGFQSAGDARSSVILESSGCGNGFIQWYNAGDRGNLGRNNFGNRRYLDVLFDINVYATCTEFGEESAPSQTLSIKYLSAPPFQPFIIQDKKVVCDGELITLQTNLPDKGYIYRWERGITPTPTEGRLIDNTTIGQGSPTLKAKIPGYYFLSVISPDCPNA